MKATLNDMFSEQYFTGEDKEISVYLYDEVTFKAIDLTGTTIEVKFLDATDAVTTYTGVLSPGIGEFTFNFINTDTLKEVNQRLQIEITSGAGKDIFITDNVISIEAPLLA
jgi:hypothetical protein